MSNERQNNNDAAHGGVDSTYAWTRLALGLLVSTIGGVGMWSAVVALPAVQAEFGVARADASLAYTMTMIGFGAGTMILGRMTDRFGIIPPVLVGIACLVLGYSAAASAHTLWLYSIAHGLLVGFGSSATFSPMLADMSHWFARRRGVAVAIIASGNYLAGTLWPPVVQHFIESSGWRQTFLGIALFCAVTMLPLLLTLRRRMPHQDAADASTTPASAGLRMPGMSPAAMQNLLIVAGLCCCVAMSMPQVHLVAYCGDLGYGAARGAQMLSLLLGCGIVSRLAFGWISDRIGGLRTLLIGSSLQCFALLLYLPFNGLNSLYVISALFGLFQGGIVPSYAMIIREYFPPRQAGTRIGVVLTATMVGMALGGWMSGAIFDLTGSYRMAFLNGVAWNLVNMAIALTLLLRSRGAAPGAIATA